MNGMELSRLFWTDVAKPRFENAFPLLTDRWAVGLVGEGSECFGFDDEVSRDHDWGPSFCLWLCEDDYSRHGAELTALYESLPNEYMGFQRMILSQETASRVGIHSIPGFYARYTGFPAPPDETRLWRYIPEDGLSVVTNGCVFFDGAGDFSQIRNAFLAYFPEELRKKKLARHCALAGQAGQYNYQRCLLHSEPVAAFAAKAEFIREIQFVVFELNRTYKPYYKWEHRAMGRLPILGGELSPLIEVLTRSEGESCVCLMEEISGKVANELRRQRLSEVPGEFLVDHAVQIQSLITDPELSALHLMAE